MKKSVLHGLIIFNLTLLPVIFLASCSNTKAVVLIPDLNFEKALIKAGLDDKEDGKLTITDSITKTTSLNISIPKGAPSDIKSLVGIEWFTSLTHLNCSGNQLTTLDVSKNTSLTNLNCYGNQLTTLDVSNTSLTNLYCRDNQLTTLDVSKNISLTNLDCINNKMNGLDISRCSELTQLQCDNNINNLYQIFYFISLNKIRIGIESTNRLLEKNTQHESDR